MHSFSPAENAISFTDNRLKTSPVIPSQKEGTCIPPALKSGLENLSGYDLSDVTVHRNSAKPVQMNALAYAQHNEIHLGPGQEKHLPHEGWHIVQQKQGRVKPTLQLKSGIALNDDVSLEKEADVMGQRAVASQPSAANNPKRVPASSATIQREGDGDSDWISYFLAIGFSLAIAYLLYHYLFKAGKITPKKPVPKISRPSIREPKKEDETDEKADVSTLEGIAKAINRSPEDLLKQLTEGSSQETSTVNLDELNKKLPVKKDGPWLGVVPPFILKSLEKCTTEQEKVDQLFLQINNLSFTYNGNSRQAAYGFLHRSGDCGTLAKMFFLAAKAADIKGVKLKMEQTPMLVSSCKIHGRNETFNVEGLPYWFFIDHTWCLYNGKKYDLLFMTNDTPEVHLLLKDKKYKEMDYLCFSNGTCMILSGVLTKHKLKLENHNRLGIVFSSEEELLLYIDKYKV